jgi:hypothetical protein
MISPILSGLPVLDKHFLNTVPSGSIGNTNKCCWPSRVAVRLIYNPLFHASAEALRDIARDPRHLGAGSSNVVQLCILQPP